eukprot:scaffold1558_cov403-Prasinococcus_capsulatus_cf.AAC.29
MLERRVSFSPGAAKGMCCIRMSRLARSRPILKNAGANMRECSEAETSLSELGPSALAVLDAALRPSSIWLRSPLPPAQPCP